MTKTEIIENLYKAGKITFEEAMTLSNKSGNEPELNLHDGAVVGRQNIKDQTIDEFLHKVTEEFYCEEDPDENLAFDSAKCVAAMKANNWEWWNEGVPSEETFKDHLRDEVKRAIEGLINSYKKNGITDDGPYYSSECGGIRVEAWIEVDHEGKEFMVVKPQFILEQGEFDLEPSKFKNIL